MKSWVLAAVAVLVASVASAQPSGVTPSPIGQVTAQESSVHADAGGQAEYKATSALRGSVPSSLRDSLAHLRYEPLSVTSTASQDPRHDWSRLRQLEGSEIVLRAQGLSARRCKLLVVDDAALTAVDLENASRPPLWVPRADVEEVSQWIGRRGSVLGAVLGTGVGFFATVVFAQWASTDGRHIWGQRIVVPLGLAGPPIAGGFLGYRLPGDRRALTTIYLRP